MAEQRPSERERFIEQVQHHIAHPGPHPPRLGPPDGVIEVAPGRYVIEVRIRDGVWEGWEVEEKLETEGWIYERFEGKRVRVTFEVLE